MNLASLVTPRKVLVFSLVTEGATALAVFLFPGLVSARLFGAAVAGAGVASARLTAIALLALVVACWPGTGEASRASLRAILVYDLLAAAYLAWLGSARAPTGLLLWPAVGVHALVALLLWRGAASRVYHQSAISPRDAARNAPAVQASRPPELRVLLVDDDDSLRRALVRTIRLAGYRVDGYAGAEALIAAGVPVATKGVEYYNRGPGVFCRAEFQGNNLVYVATQP